MVAVRFRSGAELDTLVNNKPVDGKLIVSLSNARFLEVKLRKVAKLGS